MPEESINIFISNIYATAIFSGIFFALFILMFFISRIFIYSSKREDQPVNTEKPEYTSELYSLNKDTSILKTVFASGIIFIMIIFSFIIVFLSFNISGNLTLGGSLYLIFIIIFLLFLSSFYIIKSGIFK